MPEKIHSLVDLQNENTQRIWLEELANSHNDIIDDLKGREGTKFNLIDNADFAINQEGYTTGTIAAGTTEWGADRHWAYHDSDATVTYARETVDVPTFADVGAHIYGVHKLTVTAADTALASTQELAIVHSVEGYDWQRHLSQRECTLSFWAKTNKLGTYHVVFQPNASGSSYVMPLVITSSGDWNRYSFTLTFDDIIGTWDTTNGIGLRILIVLAAGSFWDSSADNEWIAGNKRGSSTTRVNLLDAVDNYFSVGAYQLESGNEATDFMVNDYHTTERKCKRYYQRNKRLFGYARNSTTNWFNWPFEVEMRAAPTVVLLTTTPYTESLPFVTANIGSGSTITGYHTHAKSCDMLMDGFTSLGAGDKPSMCIENQIEADARI